MSETKKLLEVRKTIKARKPTFLQQDYHKKRRLSAKWKRPTGLQSKMRHQFKGYSRRVKQGWRSPVEIRGFHSSGYEPLIVNTLKDLDNVQKHQGIIVGATVGLKKKLAIIDKAVMMKIPVLNVKPETLKLKAENLKKAKAEEKIAKSEKKKKTLEESLKKADKDKKDKEKQAHAHEHAEDSVEAADAEKSEEEKKKEEEKKIKDDVLIHKQ